MADSTPAPAAPILRNPFQPVREEAYGTGDIATARAISNAEGLIKSGIPKDRVVAALVADGIDASLLEERSPAQIEHDRLYNIDGYVDPQAVSWFELPAGIVADTPALNQDLRHLAADLALARTDGGSFAALVVKTIAQQNAQPDLAGAAERNRATLESVYGAEGYAAKAAAINAMLSGRVKVENKAFVDALKPTGILGSSPMLFARLAAQADRLARWSASRPK